MTVIRVIPQAHLTAECWIVQMEGPAACVSCEARDTRDCGGQEIRRTGQNSRGYPVPLGSPRPPKDSRHPPSSGTGQEVLR